MNNWWGMKGQTNVFTGVQPVESDCTYDAADTSTNHRQSRSSSFITEMTYKIPRLRPHATVIFSLRFMLSSHITNHGRIAKQKSAMTNQAAHVSNTPTHQITRDTHNQQSSRPWRSQSNTSPAPVDPKSAEPDHTAQRQQY